MSVSDNSTPPVARDNEGSFQLLEGQVIGVGDLPVNSYEKSPYTDREIISLDVGPTQTRYRVHRAILSQSPELDAKPALKLWGEKTNDTISLPELDETTAHTLVHYLYTGKYQALQSYEAAEKGAIPQYKLGTCVYCAATRYKLPGLAELAKEKITSLGEDLTILDVLRVARENAFPLLPEDEAWFPAYLEDAIKGAVNEDPELFMKPGFVDQIEGDRKFRQVVMKAIVNTYSRGPIVSSPPSTGIPASVTEEIKHSDHAEGSETSVPHPEPATSIENGHSENPTASSQDPLSVSEAVPHESVKLDEIEPTAVPPEAPEPFTDELGFGKSTTYQKMGKKPEDTTNNEPTAAMAASKPAHTRTDSVMQVEETVAAPAKEGKTPATPEPADDAPAIADGTNGNAVTPKKSKKKSKKKASSAVSAS